MGPRPVHPTRSRARSSRIRSPTDSAVLRGAHDPPRRSFHESGELRHVVHEIGLFQDEMIRRKAHERRPRIPRLDSLRRQEYSAGRPAVLRLRRTCRRGFSLSSRSRYRACACRMTTTVRSGGISSPTRSRSGATPSRSEQGSELLEPLVTAQVLDERGAQAGPFPSRKHHGPERSTPARLTLSSPLSLRHHGLVPPASSSTLSPLLPLLDTFHLMLSFTVRLGRDGMA